MTDIRERLVRAVGDFAQSLPETSTGAVLLYSHRKGVTDAMLAQLPLTQAQLDGLASGDMVVVPSKLSGPQVLKVAQKSGERYGPAYIGYGPLEWHYETMISAAQEEQP